MSGRTPYQRGLALLELLQDAYYNRDAIARLLEKKPDLNVRNSRGETALLMAASSQEPEAIDMLVAAGAEIDATVASGNTALMLCLINGDARSVDILIRGGADPHLINNQGQNAFDVARHYEHPHLATQMVNTMHICAREAAEKEHRAIFEDNLKKGLPLQKNIPASRRLKPKPPAP